MTDAARLITLRQVLEERFNDEELRTLCQNLGVEYDDLPAQGRANKARELVAFMDRRGRLDEFEKKLREYKPLKMLGASQTEDVGEDKVITVAPMTGPITLPNGRGQGCSGAVGAFGFRFQGWYKQLPDAAKAATITGIVSIFVALCGLAGTLGAPIIQEWARAVFSSSTPTTTPTLTVTPTPNLTSALTITSTVTSTDTPTPSPTSTPSPEPTPSPDGTRVSMATSTPSLTPAPISSPPPQATDTPIPISTVTASIGALVVPTSATPDVTPISTFTPMPIVTPTIERFFGQPIKKDLRVDGTKVPDAVTHFLLDFCVKADEGQTVREIAEKHGVDSNALQQANSIREKDKWQAKANELIVIPNQERDIVDSLMRLTVDLANASQVRAVTGECRMEELGIMWDQQPREETASLRKVLLAKDAGNKSRDCPICARSGSIVPQVLVDESGWLLTLSREQWDYYYALKTSPPSWHRYTWTTIVLYQFEAMGNDNNWKLTYYQTRRARQPDGPVPEPKLPDDCLR